MHKELDIYIDGACIGNPGEAAIGVVVKHNDKILKEISKPIGQGTNNMAEYNAFICALQEALILKAERIRIYTDSELLFRQMGGYYKVKSEQLKPLFTQAQHLMKGFSHIECRQIPREENKQADQLASKALKILPNRDKGQAKVVVLTFPQDKGKV